MPVPEVDLSHRQIAGVPRQERTKVPSFAALTGAETSRPVSSVTAEARRFGIRSCSLFVPGRPRTGSRYPRGKVGGSVREAYTKALRFRSCRRRPAGRVVTAMRLNTVRNWQAAATGRNRWRALGSQDPVREISRCTVEDLAHLLQQPAPMTRGDELAMLV